MAEDWKRLRKLDGAGMHRIIQDSNRVQFPDDPPGIAAMRELVAARDTGQPIPDDVLAFLTERARAVVDVHDNTSGANRATGMAKALELLKGKRGRPAKNTDALSTRQYEWDSRLAWAVAVAEQRDGVSTAEAVKGVAGAFSVDERTVRANLREHGEDARRVIRASGGGEAEGGPS